VTMHPGPLGLAQLSQHLPRSVFNQCVLIGKATGQ